MIKIFNLILLFYYTNIFRKQLINLLLIIFKINKKKINKFRIKMIIKKQINNKKINKFRIKMINLELI